MSKPPEGVQECFRRKSSMHGVSYRVGACPRHGSGRGCVDAVLVWTWRDIIACGDRIPPRASCGNAVMRRTPGCRRLKPPSAQLRTLDVADLVYTANMSIADSRFHDARRKRYVIQGWMIINFPRPRALVPGPRKKWREIADIGVMLNPIPRSHRGTKAVTERRAFFPAE